MTQTKKAQPDYNGVTYAKHAATGTVISLRKDVRGPSSDQAMMYPDKITFVVQVTRDGKPTATRFEVPWKSASDGLPWNMADDIAATEAEARSFANSVWKSL